MIGSIGSRRFVISFTGARHYDCPSCTPVNVQIHLVEFGYFFEVHYLSSGYPYNDVLTLGIESLDYQHYTIYSDSLNTYSGYSGPFPNLAGTALAFATDTLRCTCGNHLVQLLSPVAQFVPYPIFANY